MYLLLGMVHVVLRIHISLVLRLQLLTIFLQIYIEASLCVEECWTHEDAVLNQFDHLPLSAMFPCTVCTEHAIDLLQIKMSVPQQ